MYILVQPRESFGEGDYKFSIHTPYIPTTIEQLTQDNPDYYIIREMTDGYTISRS